MRVSFIIFCLLLTAVSAQTIQMKHINEYIENPALYAENQEPAHVTLTPFETVEQALSHDPQTSPFYQSLNDEWSFSWAMNPAKAPYGFWRQDYDVSDWASITVPGTWQMQGWGHNVYRNIPMPFGPYDPPLVPDDINPTGAYVRTFTIPQNWQERDVYLHFDGVKSAYWVWINGEYVGFDKGSMTAGEFRMTDHLQTGENKIAVQVVRWSDGSYLEDQDMWRFSGIYRRVYLMARPKIFIRDFQIITELDENYQDATLSINLDLANLTSSDKNDVQIRATLFDDQQEIDSWSHKANVAAQSEKSISLQKDISNPKKWSAEKPHLYSLTLELLSESDERAEVLEERIGFREIEIKDRQVHINGVPVKIKGANRHEHDPFTGRTMTKERLVQDFKLMKRLNINSIRTSHYPDDPLFYELADEYGFYICDEVNAECHYGENYLAAQPGWELAFMDRTERYVERDKNHPSIMMWSMGNECGLAGIHYEMADYCRRVDPTRPVYHQTNQPNGDAPFADICGTRYPSPAFLDMQADTSQRPIIMGEYSHNMGNGLGHFDEYWEVIYSNPAAQGGYIWDWVNQGVEFELITTPDESPYEHQSVLHGRPKIVDGQVGNAIPFSGIEDFVEIDNHPDFNVAGDQLTLSAQVLPRGFISSNSFITKGESYALEQNAQDSLTFTITTDQKHQVSAFLPRDWNYNWHHIAGVYDGRTISLFIDTKKVAEESVSGHIARNRHPVNIGRNHKRHHEQWPGFLSNAIVDEVRIYKTALVEEQLSLIMNEKENLLLYLPFEETSKQGTFFSYGATPQGSGTMDGVVNADRELQPEAHQLKKSQEPVYVEEIDASNGLFRIHNRFHFTNLNELGTTWTLYQEDTILKQGQLSLDIPPLSSDTVTIPVVNTKPDEGAESRLVVSFQLAEQTWWADDGYEVAFGEFVITPRSGSEFNTSGCDAVQVLQENDTIAITGNGFQYTLDKTSGIWTTIETDDLTLKNIGPVFNVWRTPIMNEWSEWGVKECARWYQLGLDTLVHRVQSVNVYQPQNDRVCITLKMQSTSALQPDAAFNQRFTYTVFGCGDIVLDHKVTTRTEMPDYPNRDLPWLAKLGLQFNLPNELGKLTWYGRGPWETYPDRKTAAKIGIYTKTLNEIKMPYIIPQDFDNRTDVSWAAVQNEDDIGLAVFSDKTMNVSIDPYKNLDQAWYPFQLQRGKNYTLNIDHSVTGVGGTPIQVQAPYRTYPDRYEYKIRIKPVSKDNSLKRLGRENF